MSKVSVILPTYNCDTYINECLDSLLAQTFTDFEILIIDDCSKDQTVEFIKAYSDERIKLRVKEENTGYTDSLNWGVQNAQGAYIARMDGDDICHPERFEKQVAFLDANSDVALLGTNARVIDGTFTFNYPSDVDAMRAKLLFGNNFVHPSVMGRAAVFRAYPYDRTREPAEDYDLWTRIAASHKVTNLPEVLLFYRVHDGQISTVKKDKQDISARKSMYRMFQLLDYDREKYDTQLIENAIWPHRTLNGQELKKGIEWYKSLIDHKGLFKQELLLKALSRKRYNFIKFYAQNPELLDSSKSIKPLFLKEFPVMGAKYYYRKLRS